MFKYATQEHYNICIVFVSDCQECIIVVQCNFWS